MAQEDLHYQLARTQATALILQKLIDLRCEIRDCNWNTSRPTGFASPGGYPLAVSFDVIGGAFGRYHPIAKPWIRKEIRLYTRPIEGSVEVDYMGEDQAFALYALESDLK
jgi:hypothetical protein